MNFPKPVILGCAEDDLISDKRAVYAAMVKADKFYRRFGEIRPDENCPDEYAKDGVTERGSLVYMVRHGIHSVSAADWRTYMDIIGRKTSGMSTESLMH